MSITPTQLPPDPEGCNDRRSVRANTALEAYIEATGTDHDDALTDLIADLLHWCDRNQFDFDACLEQARRHYAGETAV